MRTRARYMAGMLLAAASYGAVTPLAKAAHLAGIPVRVFTSLQYPVPLLLFFLLPLARRKPHTSRLPNGRDWLATAVVGALGAATALTYYQAVRLLPAADAVLFLFQFTWILPLLAWMLDNTVPSRRQWWAIAAVWLGTALAAGLRGFAGLNAWGIVLGLAAGAAYAGMLYGQGRIAPDVTIWQRSQISTLTGAVIVWLVYRPWQSSWAHPLANMGWGTLVGVVGQALPLFLMYWSAPRLSNALVAVLAAFELPVAVSLSVFWLGESVTWATWLGTALILAGIAGAAT